MKIIKNSVQVSMNMSEFLDILEGDMFEDLLIMIMELDEQSTAGDFFEFSDPNLNQKFESIFINNMTVEDMDGFIEMMEDAIDADFYRDYDGPLESVEIDGETYWGIPMDDIRDDKKKPTKRKQPAKKKVNTEDVKVKRLLDKYKDV